MRRKLHGRFNCRTTEFFNSPAFGATVFVDGVDMTAQCCYIDTESGFIKTYDLCGARDVPKTLADGEPHFGAHWLDTGSFWHDDVEDLKDEGTICPSERLLVRIVRGSVELFAKESAGGKI